MKFGGQAMVLRVKGYRRCRILGLVLDVKDERSGMC